MPGVKEIGIDRSVVLNGNIESSLRSDVADHLHPLVIPSHTSICFFDNQQWVKERNIHFPKNVFQTGSAGRQASFF